MNTNEYEACRPLKDELDEAIKERDAEIPMPHMTTTDKLMQPSEGKEVEG